MSTILKALQKSAAERRLGETPSLEALPDAKARGRERPIAWGEMGMIAVLICLALLTIGYLLRPREPAVEPQPAAQRIAQADLPARAVDKAQDTAGEQPRDAPEPTGARTKTTTASPDTQATQVPAAPTAPAPESRVAEAAPAPAARPQPQSLPEYALLPRYRNLPQARRAALPPLTLNVLIYADDPARRFVLINLDRYAEGDQVTEGLRIVEIIETGVVLEDGQGRFVLPRP